MAKEKIERKTEFLLSSDSLPGYGLDLVFEVAKKAWFDGLDLATWKNFDAWNTDYVKKLSETHDLPVKVIQISDSVNAKELNQALDLCEATGADTITINAPKFLDFKAYNFIVDNLPEYRKSNPDISFSIINPVDATVFALPIPKYRFTNIVEIVKKYGNYLGLDIATLDEEALENDFMRKIDQFAPYISVLYFSDKTKLGEPHRLPGEGVLKLSKLLKKFKANGYNRYMSTKLEINKGNLSDSEKVVLMLEKARNYYKDNFEEIDLDD